MNKKIFEVSVNDTNQRYVVFENDQIAENEQSQQVEPVYEHCAQRNDETVDQDHRIYTSMNGKF